MAQISSITITLSGGGGSRSVVKAAPPVPIIVSPIVLVTYLQHVPGKVIVKHT